MTRWDSQFKREKSTEAGSCIPNRRAKGHCGKHYQRNKTSQSKLL